MAVAIANSVDVTENVMIGDVTRSAYCGSGVVIGDNVNVENHDTIYLPARREAGAFIGPAAVFANDQFPRSVNPDVSLKAGHESEPVARVSSALQSMTVQSVSPHTQSDAGRSSPQEATFLRGVSVLALVLGVPARRVGWVGPQAFQCRRPRIPRSGAAQ